MAIVAVLFLGVLAAGAALVALMPPWLRRALAQSFTKAATRRRSTGARSPYFGPNTDPERFLGQLGVMAAACALLCAGLLVAWAAST